MMVQTIFYSKVKKGRRLHLFGVIVFLIMIIAAVGYYFFILRQDQVAVQQEAGRCVEGEEEVRDLCARCSPRVPLKVLYKCVNGKMVRWKNIGEGSKSACSHCPPEPPKTTGSGGSTSQAPPPTLIHPVASGYCPLVTADGRVLVAAYYDVDGKKCIYGPPGQVDKDGNIKPEERTEIVLNKTSCDSEAIKTCARYGGTCKVIGNTAKCVDCTGKPIRSGGACGPTRLGAFSWGTDCQCYECVQSGGQYKWVVVDDARCGGGGCGTPPTTSTSSGPPPTPTSPTPTPTNPTPTPTNPTPTPTSPTPTPTSPTPTPTSPTPTPTSPTPTPTSPTPTLTPTVPPPTYTQPSTGDIIVEKVYSGECKTGKNGEYEEITYLIRVRYPEDPDLDLAPITVDNLVDTYDSTIDSEWIAAISDGGSLNSAEHTITWGGFTLTEGQSKVFSYIVNYPADVFGETFLNTVRVNYTVGDDVRSKEDTVSLEVQCMVVTVPPTGVFDDNPVLAVFGVFVVIWLVIFLDRNYNIFVPILLNFRLRRRE